jgi:hypothetical protein
MQQPKGSADAPHGTARANSAANCNIVPKTRDLCNGKIEFFDAGLEVKQEGCVK